MKKGLRIGLIVGVRLIGLALIAVIVVLLVFPVEYLRRVVTYGESDVQDYLLFPERVIQAAATPIPFAMPGDPAAAEAMVNSWFEEALSEGVNLEAFLSYTRTQAFIVIQDDTVLYEKYFNGCQRESIVTSFSTAKSFVSTMIGIAIAEGKISSLNDPITGYLPELLERDPHFAEITIRHLLNMSSGIKYLESSFVTGDDALTYYYPDLRELALQKTVIAVKPGQHWDYNNYHPLLLGLILERVTGMDVAEYLQTKVWQPMGAEFAASWSLDSEQTAFEQMASGINARAIDFAKLGRLYLNGGRINDIQVLPQEWVDWTTTPDPTVDRTTFYPASMSQMVCNLTHQGLWWGIQMANGDYGYLASGDHGQFIFVHPEKRIIIVRNGEDYGILSGAWFELFMVAAQQAD